MERAAPPISSYGKLAQLCLEGDIWPESSGPKPKSLATLFSKLDRGQDLDWLRDRKEVQEVLSDALGCRVADLSSALGEAPAEDDGRILRLRDVRFARQIDLAKEALPPGIPRLATDPPHWQCVWWHASSGSGFGLTARWLRVRGLAHTAVVKTRQDLFRLPPRGALFVEIGSRVRPEDVVLSDQDIQALRLQMRPVCFAASFAPPHSIFQTLHSPELSTYLPELVDWVDKHLDGSGHFSKDRAEAWMRKVVLPSRAASTLGDALGQLGVLDEIPPRTLLAKSLDELAAEFIKRRLRENGEASNENPRIAEEAFFSLSECAARLLTQEGESLEASRDLTTWTAWLSSTNDEALPDPDWFTAALKGSLGSQVSSRDLRRAARKLPPSSFQLSRALKRAGLLFPSEVIPQDRRDVLEQSLSLGPRFVVSVLSARATYFALRLPATAWGRALLSPTDSERVLGGLLDAVRRGDFAAIFSLIDDEEESSIFHDAAVEAAVIACALASLEGRAVPDEILEGLADLISERLLSIDGLFDPRVVPKGDGQGLYRRALFVAAVGEIARLFPLEMRRLDPFRSGSPRLAQHIATCAQGHLKDGSLSLRSRKGILRLLLELPELEESSDGFVPPACVTFFKTGDARHLKDALDECPGELLKEELMSRGKSESSVMSMLWGQLKTLGSPQDCFEAPSNQMLFIQCMPVAVVQQRLSEGLMIAWDQLLPHQYAKILEAGLGRLLPSEGARLCPLDAALIQLKASGADAFNPVALREILDRAGARLGPLVSEWIESSDVASLARLLKDAPPSFSSTLQLALGSTSHLLSRPTALVECLRSALLRAVQRRDPDYAACYERLMEIEESVGALRRLR